MKSVTFGRLTTMKSFTMPFAGAAGVAVLLFVFALKVPAQEASSLSSVLGRITSASQSSPDSTLQSLGGELAGKAQSLNTSLVGNPATQTALTGALQSLLGNKGPEAVAAFQKLSAAKLTPEQLALVKEVSHVGSAYLVQKNLGALEGSQSDVAQIVTSLRKGNVTAALPAIHKVSQNVNLTPAQKDLLTAMAEKLAPGAGKTGEAIGNGLKSLPGLGH